jgi:lipopolysaccharide/colanic/teichoic acid biosynthesis glycosyltransferase
MYLVQRHDKPAIATRSISAVEPHLDGYGQLKRVLDLVVAALLLALTAPVIALCMVLVRLGSRGSPLYTQQRLGHRGRIFTIYKIRTMVQDCERESGPVWSRPGDRRVTPIGRFLRWSHLDELPQLWNVVRGEMSLIGPRPERPEIAAQLELAGPRYRDRLLLLPGLSGLAQVMQPPDSDLESVRRKLQYDLLYLDRMGLGLDLRICLATALHLAHVPVPVIARVLRTDLEHSNLRPPIRSLEANTPPESHSRPSRVVRPLFPPQPLPAAGALR